MLKWYLLSEIRVIYIREGEGGADRHTNNINWGSVNSAVGPFEAFSLEFALGLEVPMWLSVCFPLASCYTVYTSVGLCNLGLYTAFWGRGQSADLSVTPFICAEQRPGRHSLHEWCFSHSKCDHVSGSQDAETLDVVSVKGLSPFIPVWLPDPCFYSESLSISLSAICIKRL